MLSKDRYACSAEKSTRCFLAIRLISQFPIKLCRFNRKYSRTMRLILFRLTAGPTFLVTVMPIRDRPCWLVSKTAIKCLFWILRPLLDSAINSCRFNILSAFVNEKRKGPNPSLSENFTSAATNFRLDAHSRPHNCMFNTNHKMWLAGAW